jgi:hypothetical protein
MLGSLSRCTAGVFLAAWLAGSAGISAPVLKGKEEKTRPDTEEAKPSDQVNNLNVSRNNLKKIGLGFHLYLDRMSKFPADVLDKKGKPILSWRVLLLKEIGEGDLFKQFKLDEPWDSKHNLALLDKMPKIYQSPRVTLMRKSYTVYQVFTGEETAFPPGKPGIGIARILDGTSNTILAVEATAAVPWTKPADIPFDLKKNLPDFGKAFGKKPLCVLFDGSTRTLDLTTISAPTLKNAIMPADGNVLGPDW